MDNKRNVKIQTDYVVQDKAKISKILERIEKILSASHARANTASQ
jgi:hypothetical protein